MKKLWALLLMNVMALSGCIQRNSHSSTTDNETNETQSESTVVDNKRPILQDPKFETGFHLREWTTVNGGPEVRYLDYGGTAKKSDGTIWTMARWWSPFDFANATESKIEGGWKYEDESSYFTYKGKNGELTMHLDSWKEYQKKFGGSRTSTSQNWSHFLIEQTSNNGVFFSQAKEIWVDLEFKIDNVELKDEANYNPSIHTAQLCWYLTLQNFPDEGATDQGTKGDFMWFGIPLYDYRYKKIDTYRHIDTGFAGSTNKLIYSISNAEFLDEETTKKGIMIGKSYKIHLDIYPLMKEALIYGITNGALVGCTANHLRIAYMNFGWEVPGSFIVNSTIKNMGITAILKG